MSTDQQTITSADVDSIEQPAAEEQGLPLHKLYPAVDADGIFLGEVILYRDQLDPTRYIFVDGAVDLDKPRPLQPRECAKVINGAWAYLPDWRAVALYDKSTGNPVLAVAGDTPESLNATTLARPGPGFTWQGDTWTETPQAITLRLINAVQLFLDDTARAQGFEGIDNAISFADEPAVPQYQAQGQAFRAWRSQIRAARDQVLAGIAAGTHTAPTEQAFIADLLEAAPNPFTASN